MAPIAPPALPAGAQPDPAGERRNRNRSADPRPYFFRAKGNQHRLYLNGQLHGNVYLAVGSGTDVANYIAPAMCRFLPKVGTTIQTRRHGVLVETPGPMEEAPLSQRIGICLNIFVDVLKQLTTGYTDEQYAAMAFAFYVIHRNEAHSIGVMNNWSYGNMRAFTNYASGPNRTDHWTVNPHDRLSYNASPDAVTGARYFINRVVNGSPYGTAFQYLTGANPPSGVVAAALREIYAQFPARNGQPSLRDQVQRFGRVNPFLLYLGLGEVGYFNTAASQSVRVHSAVTRLVSCIRANFPTFEENMRLYPASLNQNLSAPIVLAKALHDPSDAPLTRVRYTSPFPPTSRQVFAGQAETTVQRPISLTDANESNGTGPSTTTTTIRDGVSGTPGVNPVALEGNDQFTELFFLYAQYEFFRQKYGAPRTAALTLAFQPYLVAGYPIAIFDSPVTSFHAMAYLQGVSHAGMVGNGSGSMGTSIQVTCVRSFNEFLADVQRDAGLFGRAVHSAPAEVINEIRDLIQNQPHSETYYSRMFFNNAPRPNNQQAAFNYRNVVGYAQGADVVRILMQESTVTETTVTAHPAAQTGDHAPTHAEFEAANATVARLQAEYNHAEAAHAEAQRQMSAGLFLVDAIIHPERVRQESQTRGTRDRLRTDLNNALAAQRNLESRRNGPPGSSNAAVVSRDSSRVEHNIDPNRPLSPIPGEWADGFESYDKAMQLVARPVCTLEQYIRFMHGGATLGDLIAAGSVEGEETDFGYATEVSVDTNASGRTTAGRSAMPTATYYRRIYKLRQGPGERPGEQERGYTAPPFAPSAGTRGLRADYPQTRTDWDSVLEAYVERVRLGRADR